MKDNTTDLPAMLADLPVLLADCLRFDFDVMTSPARLGSLLTLCRLFTELEEEAKHAAIALALKGTEIPGWTLVRRDGNAYVETGDVLKLLERCQIDSLPSLLPAIAETLGNISEEHYYKLLLAAGDAAGVTAASDVVKKSGATVYLRKNNKKEEVNNKCPNTQQEHKTY